MRATQSMYSSDQLRVACYVDDPYATALGNTEQRLFRFSVVTLFWCVLNFSLAWSKGRRGSFVTWIGASLQIDQEAGVFVVSLPEEERTEAFAELCRLRAQGKRLKRRDLRSLTGRLEWMAGMLPQLRPFAQMFWAALASSRAGPLNVWFLQVRLAVQWFEALFSQGSGLIARRVKQTQPIRSQSLNVTPPWMVAAQSSGLYLRPCPSTCSL
jgi:hypothetical protein